jgi:hypothetical protein
MARLGEIFLTCLLGLIVLQATIQLVTAVTALVMAILPWVLVLALVMAIGAGCGAGVAVRRRHGPPRPGHPGHLPALPLDRDPIRLPRAMRGREHDA